MKFLTILSIVLTVLTGCGDRPKNNVVNPPSEAVKPLPTESPNLTAKEVFDAFKKANLPVESEKVFTESDDPNKLLNRPNQYTGKINFTDNRVKNPQKEFSIEVFANDEDLQRRKNYVETIGKGASILDSYRFVHKNVFLRVPFDLTPSQSDEYYKVLQTL